MPYYYYHYHYYYYYCYYYQYLSGPIDCTVRRVGSGDVRVRCSCFGSVRFGCDERCAPHAHYQ